MNIVYVHGLDSDANSNKGLLLESYCQEHYPTIKVHRPDLNQPPEQVFNYLTGWVTELSHDTKTVLIGSSLGGYFSSLVSNHTGCGALLLNPSKVAALIKEGDELLNATLSANFYSEQGARVILQQGGDQFYI